MSDEQNTDPANAYLEGAKSSATKARASADAALMAAEQAASASTQAIANTQTVADKLNETIQQAEAAKNSALAAQTSAQKANDFISQAQNASTKSAEAASVAETNRDTTVALAGEITGYRDQSKNNFDQAKQSSDASIEKAKEAESNAKIAIEKASEATSQAALSQEQATVAQDNANSAILNSGFASEELEKIKADVAAAAKQLTEINEFRRNAEREAKKAAEAHNMSTTAGLAGAFTSQSRSATFSLYLWTAILICALYGVYAIGHARFDEVLALLQSLTERNQLLATIGAQILISIISVFAPLWLAWMASRMISQNYLLAEDYSYKAAIAKAYVGFKSQAAGLDKIFEERLFAAAITQLDSTPLRLFEKEKHPGSPLQDLLQQPFMQSMLKENPTFKETFVGWMADMFRSKFYLPRINPSPANDMKPPTAATGTE